MCKDNGLSLWLKPWLKAFNSTHWKDKPQYLLPSAFCLLPTDSLHQ